MSTGFERRVSRLRERMLKKSETKNALDSLTVVELKSPAEERGLEGYKQMKKDELIAALTPEG